MNVHYVCKWCMAAALALGTNLGLHELLAAPPAPAAADNGAQVLTRGPIHEAFAETVTFDPQPGVVVSKAPPAAIEELPPEQKLEGANVAWIPGYWGWDDERNDFLWISGIWRDLPPGRQWVPGYWGQAAQGSQWTSGYWADAQVSNVQYLPEPPATAEAGPNIAAPSADATWLPGTWMWQQNRYAWRPGFWAAAQPNWDWVPAHYVWAPRGCVFVDGYWDYSIGRRGVLFAPVYFSNGTYAQPGFSYSPTMVINPSVFSDSLFLRPRYQHYYFGDYYAANYQGAGFYPSYSYNSGRYGYDPIYAHERWQHRQDAQWEQRVAADFQNRRDHVDARPPRTWAAQNTLGAGAAQPGSRGIVMATPLNSLVRSKDSPLRFQPVAPSERQKLGQQAQQVQQFRAQRQKLENGVAARPGEQPAQPLSPVTAKLPLSPIVARPNAELAKDHVPPQAHVTPKPDLAVEAKPRAIRSPEQPQPRTVNRLPLDSPQPKPQPQLQPRPSAERLASQPKPQPQPQPQPQPKPQPQPQPQPKPQPQPQPQPKPQPQPTPRVDRPAPERPADRPAAGPKPEKDKGK